MTNCPICKKPMNRSKNNICHNPKCILFLQSQELTNAITDALSAAEHAAYTRSLAAVAGAAHKEACRQAADGRG